MPQELGIEFACPAETVDDAEVMTIAWIPHVYSKKESGLKAWFDYRHLHPFRRTYLWASYYSAAIKNCYAETRDICTAEDIRPFRGHDPRNTAELMGCWLARQRFDEIGIRYDFGLRFAMTRFVNRGWHMMPRPNQLYGDELILDLKSAWIQEQAMRVQFPIHPRFQSANYKKEVDQDDYHTYLRKQIDARSSKPQVLATIIARGFLNREQAIEMMGEDLVDQAMKFVSLID